MSPDTSSNIHPEQEILQYTKMVYGVLDCCKSNHLTITSFLSPLEQTVHSDNRCDGCRGMCRSHDINIKIDMDETATVLVG